MTAIAARMRFARTGSGRVGVTATLLLLALILIRPLVAPHDPAAIVGIPLQRPGSGFLLGTDGLGRDVLSRVLWGGRSIIALSVVATGLAYLVGLAIGLVAGYTRSLLDRQSTLLVHRADRVARRLTLWSDPISPTKPTSYGRSAHARTSTF